MIAGVLSVLALLGGDADAVRRALDRLDADASATHAALLEGAAAAMDTLPRREAHRRVAVLLERALRMDPARVDETWTHVSRLYRRVREDGDAEAGVPFLDALIELYPRHRTRYRRDRAYLLLDASRPGAAREAFEEVLDGDPGDVEAAYAAADLDELLGDTDAALARYGALLEERGEIRAGLRRMHLLWRASGDFDAARAMESRLRALVNGLPEGETRDRQAADLKAEVEALRDAVRTRDALRDLSLRQERLLGAIAAAWILALGGAGWWLRRTGLRGRS